MQEKELINKFISSLNVYDNGSDEKNIYEILSKKEVETVKVTVKRRINIKKIRRFFMRDDEKNYHLTYLGKNFDIATNFKVGNNGIYLHYNGENDNIRNDYRIVDDSIILCKPYNDTQYYLKIDVENLREDEEIYFEYDIFLLKIHKQKELKGLFPFRGMVLL